MGGLDIGDSPTTALPDQIVATYSLIEAALQFFRANLLPDVRRLDPVHMAHGQRGRA